MAFYLHFPRTKTLLIHAWKNNDERSAYIISETIPSGHNDQGEAMLDSKPLHLSKCTPAEDVKINMAFVYQHSWPIKGG